MTADLPLITLVPLTDAERRDLLRLARHALHAALRQDESPPEITITPALSKPAAAFVSLHGHGHLRGCIGTLVADKPLHETIAQIAVSAAFDDPRFPPLAAHELADLEIEISRLSGLVPATPEQVCPGLHGVAVTCGEHRAVFLPQVAPQHGWDRETLLTEVCRKALLPGNAWKQSDCSLSVFVAEVFAEGAP